MTIYEISDWNDLVKMKVSIDWNHPEAEKWVKEMSMFWAGHPYENEDIKEHTIFLLENIANDAYCLSREDSIKFSPARINELVLNSEGYCGSQQTFLKIYDFVDETKPRDMVWNIEEVEENRNKEGA